nr:MAG TPA: hypothetical protein [Caudoviricetes sp.]
MKVNYFLLYLHYNLKIIIGMYFILYGDATLII